jgi:hypothetical protein
MGVEEIDKLVAEKLMGHQDSFAVSDSWCFCDVLNNEKHIKHYSNDPRASKEVLEKLRELGFSISIFGMGPKDGWEVNISLPDGKFLIKSDTEFYCTDPELEMAIALVSLKTVGMGIE